MPEQKHKGVVRFCLAMRRKSDGAFMAFPPVSSREEVKDQYNDLDIPMLEEYEVLGISPVVFLPPQPLE